MPNPYAGQAQWFVVNADFNGSGPERDGASLQIGSEMALWVVLFLYGVGVECI